MSHPDLVRQLVRHSLTWGQAHAVDEMVVTNSCTEAMSLCLRAVTQPGDTVAVESPSYYLMLQLLQQLKLKALEIPTHPQNGMSVDALELATREPVSYTHLDVYKRQPRHCSCAEIRFSGIVESPAPG